MATFITNIKFSQQGIKDIDHTTRWLSSLRSFSISRLCSSIVFPWVAMVAACV